MYVSAGLLGGGLGIAGMHVCMKRRHDTEALYGCIDQKHNNRQLHGQVKNRQDTPNKQTF